MLKGGVCDFLIYIYMAFRRVMMLMMRIIINGANVVFTEDLFKLFSSLNMGVIGVNMGGCNILTDKGYKIIPPLAICWNYIEI